jgi:predicted RNA-binding protein with PIN domain
MPSSLLQVVNSLFQTCYNNWEQAVRTQLVDNLCVFNVNTGKNMQVVTDLQTSCNKVVVKPISGCVRTACSQLL